MGGGTNECDFQALRALLITCPIISACELSERLNAAPRVIDLAVTMWWYLFGSLCRKTFIMGRFHKAYNKVANRTPAKDGTTWFGLGFTYYGASGSVVPSKWPEMKQSCQQQRFHQSPMNDSQSWGYLAPGLKMGHFGGILAFWAFQDRWYPVILPQRATLTSN